jgi:hypothetical protein
MYSEIAIQILPNRLVSVEKYALIFFFFLSVFVKMNVFEYRLCVSAS